MDDKGRSRIDFYGGVSKTFQLSKLNENGVMRKVVPVTNEQYTNKLTCFEVNGTANAKVTAQSVLPDTSQFQFVGTEIVNSVKCKKYALVETKGQKVNKYTYWVKVEPSPLDPDISLGTPVKYEMRGYNTLLGSHYDHYYLIYDWFSPELPTDDVFQVPPSLSCGDFPGPGVSHHKTIATFNPMKEFIHNEDRHVQTNFEEFINTHNKQYKHDREHHHRLNVFRNNFRFIHSKNRQGLTFRLAINHLADRTEDELRVLRGRLTTKGSNGALPSPSYDKSDAKDLPPSFDWRLYGAVTPVKDQSVCGSCWSFGTIGTIEGANFLKTGTLVRLSQQALVDCSWGFGNNGCDGGEDFRSYQWIMKHGGVPSEDSYGPYLGIDAYCHVQNSTMAAKITGYVNVTSGDSNALKFSMLKNGPISVGIDASHKTLSFYANGVYYDPQCKNGVDDLDHAVLLTGYGTINGQDYWLIKNSWSTYWGNDGYVLMSQKDNNCGVSTAATYVTM
ncbi:digestive cysteine proteinase 1 isoform X2 [Folsomia candida]|nr:digestive cysteine proteinase 1 isoform X2 [Folsomia candida]